jgi:hypothetical protein
MLLAGAIWHRPGATWTPVAKAALKSHEGGLNWLWLGVGISTLVLHQFKMKGASAAGRAPIRIICWRF